MTGLCHRVVPSLLATDVAATIAFYRDVLGFRLTGCHPDERSPEWAEVRRDGVALWFYASPPRDTPREPVLSGTLYVLSADVSALADELAGRVAFEWGPEVMDYGMLELAVRDPDGYLLAFAEPVPADPPPSRG